MRFRHNKGLLAKMLLLLAILLVGGLTLSGCIKGLQPIGWSGVAVGDGTLFVGSKEGRLVAINTADGSRQWSEPLKMSTSAGGFGCAPAAGGAGCASAPGVAIYGTPVVAGDLIYIGGYNGRVYAFNSTSLQVRWVYPRENYLKPIIGGLTVVMDKVYFGTSDGKVYALDAATGDRGWKEFETGDKIWSTPAVSDDTLFVSSFDKKLYALDTADGSKKWEFETEGAIASTPLVYDNTVYIGSFDRYLYAVDATNGSLKWKFMGNNWFWARPVAFNSIVYAGCLDGKVYALDAENGSKVAEFDMESPIASSPVLVNKSVIFVTQGGKNAKKEPAKIYSLDTTNNKIKSIATIDANISAPLSADDGILYIHTADLTVRSVDIETGAKLMTISLKYVE